MSGNRTGSEGNWKEFRPTKTMWFWSSVGVVIATIVVGFGWGGWVTGGTAEQMAEEAADKARAELIANVCVERYVSSEGFAERLAKLKEGNTWDREDMIEEGGWTKLPGIEEPGDEAADLCGNKLAEMEVPEQPASGTAKDESENTG